MTPTEKITALADKYAVSAEDRARLLRFLAAVAGINPEHDRLCAVLADVVTVDENHRLDLLVGGYEKVAAACAQSPAPDAARDVPTKADDTSLLTSSERLHQAVAVMLKDWKDGDFVLPKLAAIHMENVREKYREVGRALLAGERSFAEFQRTIDAARPTLPTP